jgi:predicted phosphoribosyltransferase
MMPIPFRDRSEGGRELALRLAKYSNRTDVLVLALPRGGVPVALEVSRALSAPLDLFLVRKLGVPGYEELAMGAIASGGMQVLNHGVVDGLQISRQMIDAVAAREMEELARRERLYRDDRPPPAVRRRIVILVDDGLATGSSMHVAVAALRKLHPAKVIVAVPTAAPATCAEFSAEVDEIVCVETPEPFYSVGTWYEDFAQVTDSQVREMLEMQPVPHDGGEF